MESDDRYFNFFESLSEFGYWKLPHQCMIECGPAAQTLAGILRISTRSMFVSIDRIAHEAGLPVPTVKRHIKTLDEMGWITNKGRERLPSGHLRRTATIQVRKKTLDNMGRFSLLPRWSGLPMPKMLRRKTYYLNWSDKAVLSLVASRMLAVSSASEYVESQARVADYAYERFHFSIKEIEATTGLSRRSIISAKQELVRQRILVSEQDENENCITILFPQAWFCIHTWTDEAGESYWQALHEMPLEAFLEK